MDKIYDSPWFLRITALLLAMLLFFSVKAENDTTKSTSGQQRDVIRNVPVEVYYDDKNLIVSGVPETVDVTIKGPMQLVLSTVASKDFTVFVDLSKLTIGQHQVTIQQENFSEKLDVKLEPEVINVSIEEKVTKEVKVEPEMNERGLAEGYYVNSMEVEPNTVKVTGAKSVIESISYVKATVAGEAGTKNDFEQVATVKVLDRDLNKLNVKIEPEKVKVKVDIEEYNKEVPIVLKTVGNPPDGVTINSVKPEYDKIRVYGSKAAVDALTSVTANVDVSNVKESGTVTLDLEVPRGATRLSADKLKVDISASQQATGTDQGTVDTGAVTETRVFQNVIVQIRGLKDGLKGTVLEPTRGAVSLTVNGDADTVKSLTATDFVIYVDANGKDIGKHTEKVQIDGLTNVQWTLSSENATFQVERV